MRLDLVDGTGIAAPALDPAYRLERYRPGLEAEWIQLLNASGEFPLEWTGQSLQTQILSGLLPGGGILARHGDQLVGCASACRFAPFLPDAVLHCVAVLPEHQGRGVGAVLSVAAVDAARQAGYPRVILQTDDYRIPAIRMYLKLGFSPVLDHDDAMRSRWSAVLASLSGATVQSESTATRD